MKEFSVSTVDFISKGDVVRFGTKAAEYLVTKVMQVNYAATSLDSGKSYKLPMGATKFVRKATDEDKAKLAPVNDVVLREGLTVFCSIPKLSGNVFVVTKVNGTTVTVFPLGGGTGYRVSPQSLTEVPKAKLSLYLGL